jgi:hypothetical protein
MMRPRRDQVVLVVGLATALDLAGIWACQEDFERPPRAGCSGDDCPRLPPISGGGTGSRSDTGVADAPRDVPADASVDVTGVVQVFAADDFQNSVAFQQTAEIRTEDAVGNDLVAAFDGQNLFQLAGVPFTRSLWLTAIPAAPADEAMVTLTPVDTTQTDPVIVPLVRGSTLDSIYGVLTNPILRSTDTGHIVMRFVNDSATPTPVPGVRATLSGMSEARIYDTGGGFSDVELSTGPLGLVIFANVVAVALPGAEQSVRLEGVAPTSVKVRIAANAATFVLIQLPR